MSDNMDENQHVQEFLQWWADEKSQSHYKKLTSSAEEICKEEVQKAGIQAIVKSRVKEMDSLRTKLFQRGANKSYTSKLEVKLDIVDLAGVRITLYVPNQMDLADRFIRENFCLIQMKEHGVGKSDEIRAKPGRSTGKYVPHFSGYRAKHYRVTLLQDSKRLNPIEIQLVTMLSHTWAEVSHDLVYKQMYGRPSGEEEKILDSLDGLIQVGEVLLGQLHDAFQRRLEERSKLFESEYKLGSFLDESQIGLQSWLPPHLKKRGLPIEFHFGSMGSLLKLLRSTSQSSEIALELHINDLGNHSTLDTSLRRYYSEQARRSKLNLSILLMNLVLPAETPITLLDRDSTWSGKTAMSKIKILVGTVLLLHDLFPPFEKWKSELFVHQNRRYSFERKASMQWFRHTEHLQAVVERNEALELEAQVDLRQPWKWFVHQPLNVINFAFKLSSLADFTDFDQFRNLTQELIPETCMTRTSIRASA